MIDNESLVGEWTLTVKGPTGAKPSSLVLRLEDGILSGTQSGDGSVDHIDKIAFNNETGEIEWTNQILKPMKLKLQFKGAVEGNTMSGKVSTGFMGAFSFTGEKH